MEPIQNRPFEEVAEKGAVIYSKIKPKYEPKENGKFLAIETDSGKEYIGTTSAEALEKARVENPKKIFYVVKIGFESAETLAHSFLSTR
ncbi:MAG: hypothetical protein HYY10_02935 [Candidatus Liptonbacteria bacterium]|nr:hypothetical protein [Candidatus Liptonbacteria bacterium]